MSTKKLILLPRGPLRSSQGSVNVTVNSRKPESISLSTITSDSTKTIVSNSKHVSSTSTALKPKSDGSTEEVHHSETEDSDLEAFYGEEEEGGAADAYLIYSFTGPKSVKVKTAAFTDVPEDGLPEEYLQEVRTNHKPDACPNYSESQDLSQHDDEEDSDMEEEENAENCADEHEMCSSAVEGPNGAKKCLKLHSGKQSQNNTRNQSRNSSAPIPVYGEAFWVGEEDKPLELKPPSPRSSRYVLNNGLPTNKSMTETSVKICGVNSKSGQITPNIVFKCSSNQASTATVGSSSSSNANLSRFISYRSSIASKTMRCPTCGRHYRNAYSLNHHICSPRKSVWRRGDVACHIIDGRQIYFCPICERPFKWLGNLTRHYYVHTGQRFFKCEICHKEFFSSYQVKRHMNSHTGLRYKCELCEKPFTCKYACAWHTRQHYSSNGSQNGGPSVHTLDAVAH